MAIKLFGHPISLCTRRVLIVLAEKKLQFELVPIDFLNGEHKRLPYTERHPFGVIPSLEDGAFKLYESRAISRYLAAKYQDEGNSLIPAAGDIEQWALFEQWASVEYSHFYGAAEKLLVQKIFNPARGIPSDEVEAAAASKVLGEKLDIINQILARQPYMAGDNFSLVDTFYMPTVDMLLSAGESLEARPNLKKWWETVSARDSWKGTVSQ